MTAGRWIIVVALVAACTGCAAGAVVARPGIGPPRTPCAPPSTPPELRASTQAGRGLLVGLSAAVRNWQGAQACNLLAAVRASGAAAIREDLDWTVVSPRQGVHRWSTFDRVIGQAARFGIVVLPLLDGEPRWARRAGLTRAFAAFTAAAVGRYGPGGTFWRAHPRLAPYAPVWFELWNEPYQPGTALTATRYAGLVVGAVKAGRRVNPAVRYLAEAETAYPRIGGGVGNWVDDMFAARPDLGTYADGFAVHPYSPQPPGPYDPASPALQVGRVEAIHAAIAAHDSRPAPLWITELGWSTCTARPPCVSLTRQARDITQAFALARTRWAPYVRALFVFGYSQPAASPTPPGQLDGYGIVDGNLRPKPALRAFRLSARSG